MSEHSSEAAHEKRIDLETRQVFAEAFALVVPFMNPDGSWVSEVDEVLAYQAMCARFPDLTEMRQFAVLTRIVMVRASGRQSVAV